MFHSLRRPQVITLGAASVASSSFQTANIIIRPQVDVFVNIGTAPVAAVDGAVSHFVAAGEALPLTVAVGQKLAAIPASGTTGTVYISEV